MALKYDDYTVSFPKQGKNSFQELREGLNNSIQQLSARKDSIEEKEAWTQLLIQQLPYAFIITRVEDEVQLINQKACELLAVPTLTVLSDLDNYHSGLYAQLKSVKYGQNAKIKL